MKAAPPLQKGGEYYVVHCRTAKFESKESNSKFSLMDEQQKSKLNPL